MQFRDVHVGEEYAYNPQSRMTRDPRYTSRVEILEEIMVAERPHRRNSRQIKGFRAKLVKAGHHAIGPTRKGTVFECRAADLVRPWLEEEDRIADIERRERLREQHHLVRDIKITHLRCRLAARGLRGENILEREGDYKVSPVTAGAEFRLDLDQMAAFISNRMAPAIDDARIGHLPYKLKVKSGKVKLVGKRSRVERHQIVCNGIPVTGWRKGNEIRVIAAVLDGQEPMPADPYEEEDE